MELDSLKEIWKDQEKGMDRYPDSNTEILSMLGKKSQSPVAKIRRNLLVELVMMIVIYSTFILYYAFDKQGQYWELGLLLGLVGVAFVFYYYRKNKLLKSMQCVACEVRSNLKLQLVTLEKYVRFYFVAGTILTPLFYYLTAFIILYKKKHHPFTGDSLSTRIQPVFSTIQDHQYFTVIMLGGVAVGVIVYFTNKWYIQRMYGQHISRLRELLRQMDEV